MVLKQHVSVGPVEIDSPGAFASIRNDGSKVRVAQLGHAERIGLLDHVGPAADR